MRRFGGDLTERLLPIGGLGYSKVKPVQVPGAGCSDGLIAFGDEHRRVLAGTIGGTPPASGHTTPLWDGAMVAI